MKPVSMSGFPPSFPRRLVTVVVLVLLCLLQAALIGATVSVTPPALPPLSAKFRASVESKTIQNTRRQDSSSSYHCEQNPNYDCGYTCHWTSWWDNVQRDIVWMECTIWDAGNGATSSTCVLITNCYYEDQYHARCLKLAPCPSQRFELLSCGNRFQRRRAGLDSGDNTSAGAKENNKASRTDGGHQTGEEEVMRECRGYYSFHEAGSLAGGEPDGDWSKSVKTVYVNGTKAALTRSAETAAAVEGGGTRIRTRREELLKAASGSQFPKTSNCVRIYC